MESILSAKFRMNSNVVVRKEGDRYLFVQVATQGLHFVSERAYELVNALTSDQTFEDALRSLKIVDKDNVGSATEFVERLESRLILERLA